jgi:hypothetical protein
MLVMVSLLSISQTILWGLSPTVGRTRTSDKCSHFAASTGVPFARLALAPPILFFFFLFICALPSSGLSPFFHLHDPLVLSSVEELTMANMALFQIIVNKCYPFVDLKRICQLSVFVPSELESLFST